MMHAKDGWMRDVQKQKAEQGRNTRVLLQICTMCTYAIDSNE